MRTTLFFVLLALSTTAFGGDFNYSSYQTARISDAAGSFKIDPASDYMIDAAKRKYHVVGTFTGKVRDLDPDFKTFITGWAQVLGLPPEVPAMFDTAVQIQEGAKTYWMPIQSVLVHPFQQEVQAGSKVHLYVLLLGAYDQAPVFAINEFSADEA